MTNQTLLVTGASGQLGRRAVEILREKGLSPIAGSRTPGKDGRRIDFDDPQSLESGFHGVDRLLLISSDALDRPGRRFEQHERAITAARKAGVKHIVYTSCSHPEADSPVILAPDHRKTEALLAASGIGHTVLRNNLYADNLLGSLPQAIKDGKIVSAAGQGAAAYVTREDCAQAAAAALASSETATRIFEITGPKAVGNDELAVVVSELAKKKVEHQPIAPAALEAALVAVGLPPPIAQLYVSFDVGIERGKFGPATDAVQTLTGKAPQSVRDFLVARRDVLVG